VHDPSRVLTLCDGVCAIIMTLLVLEIHVPNLSAHERLGHALWEIQGSLVAFTISFVVMAIAWVGHRDLFSLIARTDRGLVWLSILFLFPISLLPFGASLISQHETDAIALRIYGIILVASELTRLAIWMYGAGRPHLLFAPLDRHSRRAVIAVTTIPAAAYAVGITIAGHAPTASLIIYGLVPVGYFIAITVVRATAPPGAAERHFT